MKKILLTLMLIAGLATPAFAEINLITGSEAAVQPTSDVFFPEGGQPQESVFPRLAFIYAGMAAVFSVIAGAAYFILGAPNDNFIKSAAVIVPGSAAAILAFFALFFVLMHFFSVIWSSL